MHTCMKVAFVLILGAMIGCSFFSGVTKEIFGTSAFGPSDSPEILREGQSERLPAGYTAMNGWSAGCMLDASASASDASYVLVWWLELVAVNAAGVETVVERDDYSGGVAKGTCMYREDQWGDYIPGSDWGHYIPTQNTDLYNFEGGALKLWVGRYPNRQIHPDTLRWPRAGVPSDTVRFIVRAEVQCFGSAVFQIGGDAWLAPATLWNPPTSNQQMCCSRWVQASDGRFVLTTPLELYEVL